jgi:hypothetical protein
MSALPLVSEPRPATRCMSVDLPDPDGPMTAANDRWAARYEPVGEDVPESAPGPGCALVDSGS